jgi:H/ACA ribonucleoprotein complex subunit 4
MPEVLVKAEDSTDPQYGCEPDKRPVEDLLKKGVINLDKPRGPTSHQVSAWVKDILKVKTGHGGTLDPAVSGCLPVFLGTATRLADTLLLSTKEYVCLMRLHKHASAKDIKSLFNLMQGQLWQRPPVKSSVKRELRKRSVYGVELLEIEENDVLFKISCEAGTYIRKYCHDFGLILGTEAHMQELRRVKSGLFKEEENLVTLQDLKDAYVFWKEGGEDKFLRRCIMPMERAIDELPKVWVRDSAIDALCHGSDLAVPGVVKLEKFGKDKTVALLSLKGELVAVGKAMESTEDIMRAKKGIVVKTDKVFMEPGTYPRMWKKTEEGESPEKSIETVKDGKDESKEAGFE